MRFTDQVVVVTGGGSGIGAAIGERLAAEGAHVAVLDLREEAAAGQAERIRESGGSAEAAVADVADLEAVRAAVDAVHAGRGRVDVLVNNAGFDVFGPFLDSDPARWARLLEVNLLGQIHATRAVLPHMIAAGGGRIVNVASDAGRNGSSGEAVYSAAKGGVIAFTKSTAREMARHAIGVNCVCPGPTDTPLFDELLEATPKLGAALEKAIPLRRLAKPVEIAAAVAFLASADAGYVTGQTLSVSGGLTMF